MRDEFLQTSPSKLSESSSFITALENVLFLLFSVLGLGGADWEHHLTVQQVTCRYLFASNFLNVAFLGGNVGSACPRFQMVCSLPLSFSSSEINLKLLQRLLVFSLLASAAFLSLHLKDSTNADVQHP